MPVYIGLAEYLNSDYDWATPSPAPTCNAWGYVGATATDLGAVTPAALTTGRYHVSIDTGATVYDAVVFSLTTTDTNYADVSVLGMSTLVTVARIRAEMDANSTQLAAIVEDTGTTIPAQLNTIRGADSDTLETLSDQMDGIATWTAANVSSSIAAGTITQVRGNSVSAPITGLTLYATKQQFAIKRNRSDADADALLFIDSTTGLITVNGSTSGVTSTDASIVYVGTTLTVTIKAAVYAQLERGSWVYGIQSIHSDGTVSEVYGGTWIVSEDAIRATT